VLRRFALDIKYISHTSYINSAFYLLNYFNTVFMYILILKYVIQMYGYNIHIIS